MGKDEAEALSVDILLSQNNQLRDDMIRYKMDPILRNEQRVRFFPSGEYIINNIINRNKITILPIPIDLYKKDNNLLIIIRP